jgi:hypothetical protein
VTVDLYRPSRAEFTALAPQPPSPAVLAIAKRPPVSVDALLADRLTWD